MNAKTKGKNKRNADTKKNEIKNWRPDVTLLSRPRYPYSVDSRYGDYNRDNNKVNSGDESVQE